MRSRTDKSSSGSLSGAGLPSATGILRWGHVGRVAVAGVMLGAAVLSFDEVPRQTIVLLALAAAGSVLISAYAAWYNHRRGSLGDLFLHGQALFDLMLVTAVVHVTGGPNSQFSALYVLVIAVSAVVMPFSSSLLVTSLAILLYVSDIVFWQSAPLTSAIGLQIAVFVAVSLATGFIASRARLAGVERQELEQEVRRLKLEASDILQNLHSGVVTVDGDGNLLYTNPAAIKLLSIDRLDILGRPFVQVLDGRSRELWDVIVATQRLRLKTQRTEGYVRWGGTTFPIGVTTTALNLDEEGPVTVTAIFSDISGQKRIEELHVRNGRLEAVAELSASLAHEIKNPLASIRSSVEQLARSERASQDERFLAELVVRESDRLTRLLNEFLDFSRVRVAEMRPLDLAQVAKGAVDVVRRHPDCSRDMSIEVVGEAPLVDGDEDLLHRIIVNLVLNAVQASGGRARVTVEIREPDVTDVPRGMAFETAVLLKVVDSGPGVPEDLKDRLFDPFVTGRVGGTGLGLAIVQRAVQSHCGVVWVDSTTGEGSTFTLVLPTRGVLEVVA